MDAKTQASLEILADNGIIPPFKTQPGPRPASSYRGARRNRVKANGQLPLWRKYCAVYANHAAGRV